MNRPPADLKPAGDVADRPEEKSPKPARPVGRGLLEPAADLEALDKHILGRVVHLSPVVPPAGGDVGLHDGQVDAGEPLAGGRVAAGGVADQSPAGGIGRRPRHFTSRGGGPTSRGTKAGSRYGCFRLYRSSRSRAPLPCAFSNSGNDTHLF